MASPSALSRLMQMVSPISALSPRNRSRLLKEQQSSRLSPYAVGREDSGNRAEIPCDDHLLPIPNPPANPSTLCLNPTVAADALSRINGGDTLRHSRAGSHSRRWSNEASLSAAYLSSLADERLCNTSDAALRLANGNSAPCTAWSEGAIPSMTPGTGQATASSMFSAQLAALRMNGRSWETTPLADSSTDSLDSFAKQLIESSQLEDAFYVLDLGALDRLFLEWREAMPRVVPFYAVKCNPSPIMLNALNALGTGFDCASEAEIEQVLNMGVSPDRIIFANPCKMPSHIKYAAKAQVATTTFDSVAELDKIQALYPDARLLLRIQTRDSSARCPLGTKYGALQEEIPELLEAAAQRNLTVLGVSFHVGSGASDASAFHSAIAAAHQVFQEAAAAGRPMSLLDIGGGFTARRDSAFSSASSTSDSSSMTFSQAAQAINAALDEFFPADGTVEIIAEPGRYFAETPSTLAARVFGKRVRGERREYWINDGLYGSMNCTLYDHAVLSARPLQLASSPAPRTDGLLRCLEQGLVQSGFYALSLKGRDVGCTCFTSTVFGPTCDGLDVVLRDAALPDLEMGDWLMFPNMGAYTAAAGSSFNGFSTSQLKTFLVFSATASSEATNVETLHDQRSANPCHDWAQEDEDNEEQLVSAQLG